METENTPPDPFTLPVLQTLESLKILNPLVATIPREEVIQALNITMAQDGGGDLENRLMLQGHVLDSLFNHTIGRAISPTEYNDFRVELALRMQRQFRNGVETLRALQGSKVPRGR